MLLLDKGLKNFYTKFQVIILKHSLAITEKHDRQSSLLHPVHEWLAVKNVFSSYVWTPYVYYELNYGIR